MKTLIAAAAAMIFLAPPAWAQDAASHAQHDHQAPSQPAAPVPNTEMPKTGMKAGMMKNKTIMAAQCKMMHEKMMADSKDAAKPTGKDTGKGMDCQSMHTKMHGTDATAPAH
jgi:hypothetical protein